MRNYTFRKMTQQDFKARVSRIDPEFSRHGEVKKSFSSPARPIMSLIMGFGWAYLVISVARNRGHIENSLLQGNLPAEYHDYVFFMLAALLAVSAVMLGIHLFRFLMARRASTNKCNSGGLLAGALAAGALVYTPASVFDAGLGMIDQNSRSLLVAASSTANIDLASIAFVSSNGLN